MQRGLLSLFFVTIFLFLSYTEAEAQRRRRARERTQEVKTKSFSDNLNYEIRVGNVAFGGGFALDLKPAVNYKLGELFSAGGGYRIDYDFINGFPDDFSLFSHGPFLMGRAKVLRDFYVQADYTFFTFDTIDDIAIKQNFPSAGLGYLQGGENWKIAIEGMIILDERTRNIFNNTVEFWINFSKNF